jgi:hypothetical protein
LLSLTAADPFCWLPLHAESTRSSDWHHNAILSADLPATWAVANPDASHHIERGLRVTEAPGLRPFSSKWLQETRGRIQQGAVHVWEHFWLVSYAVLLLRATSIPEGI